MKSKIIVVLLMGFILCFPNSVEAVNYCTNDTVKTFKSLTNNINVDYGYKMENNIPIFTIRLTNVDSRFEVYDVVNKKTYNPVNNEVIIEGYKDNASYQFNIYTTEVYLKYKMATVAGINGPEQIEILVESNDLNCDDRYLGKLSVNVPKYNKYSNLEVCNGKESYELCDSWYSHNYSEEEFIEKVESYKIIEDEENIEEITNDSFLSRINTVVVNYWYVFILLFNISIYLIYKYYKRKSKDGFVGW